LPLNSAVRPLCVCYIAKMGILILVMAFFAFAVAGVPAGVLGIIVIRQSVLSKEFAIICILTAFLVAALEYSVVSGLLLSSPSNSSNSQLSSLLAPLWGWHLLPPAVIALVVWRLIDGTSPMRGVAAGLFFSIVLLVVATLPLLFFR